MAGLSKVLVDLASSNTVAPERAEARPDPVSGGPSERSPISSIQSFTDRIRMRLVDAVGSSAADDELSPADLRRRVTDELARIVLADDLPLTDAERQSIVVTVINDVLGYGPIESMLQDSSVSEIMVNGTDAIYVERRGRIELTETRFRTEAQLQQVINRIVSSVGRRVDESSPMVDARLADGSRVNAIIGPLAVDGPSLTIRKFAKDGISASQMIDMGTLTEQAITFLRASVQGELNVLVSGGTGTGKTTFLNVLSGFIPENERIVTIEDAVELQLKQRHVIRLECRPPNVEGRGEVTTRDLVRNSLRMRPDRIIVGECRGPEALDMLQAMNTGHDGSLTTLHANSPRDAISRLETMVLLTGFEIPQRAIREQLASAIDVIVQLERLRSGKRVVSSITEVVGLESDQLTLNEVFALDYSSLGPTDDPVLRPTGIPSHNIDKLATKGVTLDSSVFEGALDARLLP